MIGTRVARRSDGAVGKVVRRGYCVQTNPLGIGYPPITTSTVTIRNDHGGFEATGSLEWFKKTYRLVKR